MKAIILTATVLAILTLLPAPRPAMELDYSTYLGGSGYDRAYAVAVGPDSSAYLAGETRSLDFPTADAFQASFSGQTLFTDAFVTRFSPDGSGLVYSTYLGGTGDDGGIGASVYKMGLAVDGAGEAYVTGYTESSDFPTLNPIQGSKAGQADAFVARFDAAGALDFSTFLGGSTNDYGAACAVDGDGDAFVTGWTGSQDFPTANAFQAAHGGGNCDAFVSKLALNGSSSLVYSTYLGGSGHDDAGYGIAVDTSEAAYVTGETDSADFPTTPNAYQGVSPGGYSDAFVTKFNPAGDTLAYSTYLGGSSFDEAYAIVLDPDQAAIVTGRTTSGDYPTVFPLQDTPGGSQDAIVTKLSADGSSLVFSTYLGGGDQDNGYSIALDEGGFVYVAGATRSDDFPLAYPYQDTFTGYPNYDAFIAKFCGRSGFFVYSSYFGGAGDDSAYGIAVDGERCAYLAGGTTSDDFPLEDPFQATRAGDEDAFLSKIGHTPRLPILQSGDYDGDGTSDIAVFRESSGLWAVRGLTRLYFGADGDIPVSADYSGDGTSEFAVFRSVNGLWAARGLSRVYFGRGGDIPVPGDYRNVGAAEAGIFRPSSGLWAIRGLTRFYFGTEADVPVPAPYGDGGDAEAIFRGITGLWAARGLTRAYFGRRTDYPVPGDYDGSGSTRLAIFRPETGLWAVRGLTRAYYGGCLYKPAVADYEGIGYDEIAVYRPAIGLWAARGLTRVYFGRTLDIPVAR